MHTFLLVQEIPDEPTFNRLLENLRSIKSFPLGTNDKMRIILSEEAQADLAKRLFAGLGEKASALLVPLADTALGQLHLAA